MKTKIKLNGGWIGTFLCVAAALGAFMQEKTMQDQEKQLEAHEKRLAELEGKNVEESQE